MELNPNFDEEEIQEDEVNSPPSYILNQGQITAFEGLESFAKGEGNYRRALFTGYAGTGKTFTMNRIVESIMKTNPRIRFGMTAPTHKAVRVLKKHSDLKDKLTFGTIHSFLALKETINDKGEIEYKPDFNPNRERKIDGIHILIVDESSMLHDRLFEYIEDEMRSNPVLRVIYMGDPLQIPPVRGKEERAKEIKSTGHRDAAPFVPARQISHKIIVYGLTEPQRQAADSPIIMYAHAIREQHKNEHIKFEFKEEYKYALELLPRDRTILNQTFRTLFKNKMFQLDPDYAKVICWRNTTADYFNTLIRNIIYDSDTLPRFMLGEKLIMDAALTKGEKIIIPNNEDVVVKEVRVDIMPINYRLKKLRTVFDSMTITENDAQQEMKIWQCKVYVVKLENMDGEIIETIILHEDSDEMYKAIRKDMEVVAKGHTDQWARKEMWKQFWAMERKFAWTKYNYSITSHKAQGSTYNYAVSMEWDINENWDIEERNRIKYVAGTRSSQKLFIIR